jgi:hypothetical protein
MIARIQRRIQIPCDSAESVDSVADLVEAT